MAKKMTKAFDVDQFCKESQVKAKKLAESGELKSIEVKSKPQVRHFKPSARCICGHTRTNHNISKYGNRDACFGKPVNLTHQLKRQLFHKKYEISAVYCAKKCGRFKAKSA